MCVIIDKNTFGPVFEKESINHDDFEPIYKWVSEGFGRIVYGGTTYKKELKQSTKYMKLFKHYNDARRIIKISDEEVDEIEKQINTELEDKIRPTISDHDFKKKCNDAHIVSIAIVSKCKIVCTNDGGLSNLLRMSRFYPEGADVPKVYRHKSDRYLIKHDNIVKICKPCVKLKKVKPLP